MSRFKSLKTGLHRFGRDDDGSVLTIVGLGLMTIMGLATLVVDMSSAYALRTNLQNTADAAALAAVIELPEENEARTTALDYAEKNMPHADHGTTLKTADVVTGNWDGATRVFTPAGAPMNAIQVITRRSQTNGNPAPTFFARLFGKEGIDITASTIAVRGTTSPCLLALHPTVGRALDTGNRTLTANNCSIHVNSSHTGQAIAGNPATPANPSGEYIADSICVNGGASSGPSYSPAPDLGCSPIADPLADFNAPEVGSCDHTNYSITSGGGTLDPGVYCGGLNINSNGTITLNPGHYVIQDGPFYVGGGADIDGEGVSFHLTGSDATIDVSGGGELTFSAPTTGEMAGMLIYADRNLVEGLEHNFKGGADVSYEGTIYAPTTDITFSGNSNGDSSANWSMFIARKFDGNGNGDMTINANFVDSNVPVPKALKSGSHLVQ